VLGPRVAQIRDLRIDEPDRRRGRGTVAALAAEEVARGWGCKQIDVSVPAGAEGALRLTRALGYVVRSRRMEKRLGDTPPELPAGSRARPMTQAEYGPWHAHETEEYARSWTERGVPVQEAYDRARRDHEHLLPKGPTTENMLLSVLEHEGTRVGVLWVALRDDSAWVFSVETDERHRGRGHGRSLMRLAEAQALAAGRTGLRLNVFAGNTPAEHLYASLGYETITYHVYKELL
jgi:ribosomal protein S18 acetylase RimI-like enzyme